VPVANDDLLTVKEIADALRVCTATVYKIIDRGQLPHTRVLNSIRVRRRDLVAFCRDIGSPKECP
jgi:excisionase family DNA binding protein